MVPAATTCGLWRSEEIQAMFLQCRDAAHAAIEEMLNNQEPRGPQRHIESPWSSGRNHGANLLLINGLANSGKTTLMNNIASCLSDSTKSPRSVLCSRLLSGSALQEHGSIVRAIVRVMADVIRWLQYTSLENHARLATDYGEILDSLAAESPQERQPTPSGWFEFESRWHRFCDRLMAVIAEVHGAEAIVVFIDDADVIDPIDNLTRAVRRLHHGGLMFVASGDFSSLSRRMQSFVTLDVPLIRPSALITRGVFPDRSIDQWGRMLSPFEHRHLNVGFEEFIDRSEYRVCIGDVDHLHASRDPQKLLAKLLTLATDRDGRKLFSSGQNWQVRLRSNNESAPVLRGSFASGGGRVAPSSVSTSVNAASTVRIVCDTKYRKLDSLELLGLAASVVDHTSYDWPATALCSIVKSSINLTEGALTLDWPVWSASATPNHFLRRTDRFLELQRSLGTDSEASAELWCDRLVRAWIVLQVVEFEDSTSNKLMPKADVSDAARKALEVALSHSHGRIGLLRRWILYWLPAMVAPEFGLTDEVCREILMVARDGANAFGASERREDSVKSLLLAWHKNRVSMIGSALWRSATVKDHAVAEELEDEINGSVGPMYERVISLLELDGVVLDAMGEISTAMVWHQNWEMTAWDADVVMACIDQFKRGDATGIDIFRRSGVSPRGLRVIWDYVVKTCKLS